MRFRAAGVGIDSMAIGGNVLNGINGQRVNRDFKAFQIAADLITRNNSAARGECCGAQHQGRGQCR
jgi:hypothetical protein